MPKDYNNLYTELRKKFPEQISQNEDKVIQQVCNICVYLDGLSSKGITVNLFFWGEARLMGSTTFPHKLSHFKEILSQMCIAPDNKVYKLSNLIPDSKEFNAIVTGNSRIKVSKQYKGLVIDLIRAINALGNGGKEKCLQKCKEFVDEQFPDASVTNSNHPNYSI
ncbi:MAG: hypothetical protein AMJ43_03445 [Coxiella sp. DG_40]|nr:MAG: hypothetical protein AMJ43_03445 [Coxiella sp. DG_40]